MSNPSDFKKWMVGPAAAALCTLALSAAAAGGPSGRAPDVTEGGATNASLREISAADEDLRNRVETALHADPYFYDKHVNVSVAEGRVVLRGFVFSDWDLRNAMRIAHQAAGGARVVSELTIQEGGKR